jgi:hypothetical protein
MRPTKQAEIFILASMCEETRRVARRATAQAQLYLHSTFKNGKRCDSHLGFAFLRPGRFSNFGTSRRAARQKSRSQWRTRQHTEAVH